MNRNRSDFANYATFSQFPREYLLKLAKESAFPRSVRVLFYFMAYCGVNGLHGGAWWCRSYTDIAREIGISRSRTVQGIQELSDRGWLDIDPNGHGNINRYRLRHLARGTKNGKAHEATGVT